MLYILYKTPRICNSFRFINNQYINKNSPYSFKKIEKTRAVYIA